MSHAVKAPKKLIEVALPLEMINEEAARRKRKAPGGYPTTLHAWWAQRPVAAARAVLFAQLVNDPASVWELQNPGVSPSLQQRGGFTQRRRHLFQIIGDLVKWENTLAPEVFARAREEVQKSWREVCELNKDHPAAATQFNPAGMPGLHDPFAGGGTIPLEAQRLGLNVSASDLNPVSVLINKAMIEIPSRFAGRRPVGPLPRGSQAAATTWPGAMGLAEDVRRYGACVYEEAAKRLKRLYPQAEVTAKMAKDRPDLEPLVGQQVSVVAWLWARTVKSPSPAFSHVDVPLVSSFVLSSKADREVYVEPKVRKDTYEFLVRIGKPPESARDGTKVGQSAFRCLFSPALIPYDYIDAEASKGRLGVRLLAVVVDGPKGRLFLSPSEEMEQHARKAAPEWRPETPCRGTFASNAQGRSYGFKVFGDYFTSRQLVALTTLSDLIGEVSERVRRDALDAQSPADERSLDAGGVGARAYGEAVGVYLAFALSRAADYGSSISTWRSKDSAMRSTLGNKNVQMSWDFAEGSPFGGSSSDFGEAVKVVAKAVEYLPAGPKPGSAFQAAAQSGLDALPVCLISTDPPYYNNVAYSDLSDFYYVWLRRTLKPTFPGLFQTMAVPKAEELVASPYRHKTAEAADRFFLAGMTSAMQQLSLKHCAVAPVTIYYAVRESETVEKSGTSSTGWETFLEAVLKSGLALTGTWPVRTEGDNRQTANEANALASSIVLVCRRRPDDAPAISRREFIRELNAVLPEAIAEMTSGAGGEGLSVAPVDLSQAVIGPGMAVFSKYAAVLEADGSLMTVKTALQLINRFLAEDDFDPDTQFCLHWFEQYGWDASLFGEADKLARAKATSVEGLDQAGVLFSGKGKVRLRRWSDYPNDWDPRTDKRLPIWEALHQLIRVLKQDGESGAGKVLAMVQSMSEAIRQLAYRLYTLCERKGWAEDARAYNELVTSWAGIEAAAAEEPKRNEQLRLFGGKA